MRQESQNILFYFYIFCFKILLTNSKSSNFWKLSSDRTRIIEAYPFHPAVAYPNTLEPHDFKEDPLFKIITSTEHLGKSWVKHALQFYCPSCKHLKKQNDSKVRSAKLENNEAALDCGKPVNFTYYDNLMGVINRHRHPHVPDPQAVLYFNENLVKNKEFDIDSLERRLKKAKREKPKSIQIYIQIGNYWRIKGDAEKAIECFRKSLAASPHNSEVLLNLARVLFSLQYLDDAIFLTRRSLELQPPGKGAWQQYFTLGEIFKAYGHYHEATVHLKHSLKLNPEFEPAYKALKEMDEFPADTIHLYTLIIIICLVLGVVLVILSSVDSVIASTNKSKLQRHFNKAMAMRSLRGITFSVKRTKKSV